eukprot:gene20662-26789_t
MSIILCFGANGFGQLGIGHIKRDSNHEIKIFGRATDDNTNNFVINSNIVDIQCGSQFTIAIYNNGSIWICGSLNGYIFPTLCPVEVQYPLRCMSISCGKKHILALMEGGFVLSWGNGYFGQLGHNDDSTLDNPKLIHGLEPRVIGSRVISVNCGGSHSGALTENGRVFMWGLNKSGQCGINPKTETVLEPRLVDLSSSGSNIRASSLCCGRNHTAILTLDSRVFTWGAVACGRLASGDFHMLALAHNSSVYSWGYGLDGQTGHGVMSHIKYPIRLDFFDDLQVVNIECGAWWSTAITRSGCLFVWGYGEGGWLGINKPSKLPYIDNDSVNEGQRIPYNQCSSFDSGFNILTPQRVRSLGAYVVEKVRCGGGHTIVFCQSRLDSTTDEDDVEVGTSNLHMDTSESIHTKHIDKSPTTSTNRQIIELSAQLIGWCRHNKLSNIERALQLNANVDITDSNGNSPLIISCQSGHINVMKLLVKYGANMQIQNKKGNTALHYCFAYGYDDMGQYLIAHGADEYIMNYEGLTCYEGLTRADLDTI